MSEARIRFRTKQRLLHGDGNASSPVAPGATTTDSARSFYKSTVSHNSAALADQELREHAYNQAMDLAHRDPEAAAFLLAQLESDAPPVVAPTTTDEETSVYQGVVQQGASRREFDPMALYAHLAAYYHWTDQSMRAMPVKRLLAYYREMVLHKEAEERAFKQQTQQQSSVGGSDDLADESILESLAQRPVVWSAPVD